MIDTRPARITLIAAALAATGCAILPDVTLEYRHATWDAGARAVLTLGCLPSGQDGLPPTMLVAHSVTVSAGYAASTEAKDVVKLRLPDLDAWYSDTDLKVAFTEDGRLKSINAASTGQGEAVIKSLVGAAAALSAVKAEPALVQVLGGVVQPRTLTTCEALAQRKRDGDPVTLSYRVGQLRGRLNQKGIAFEPTSDSQTLHDLLKDTEGFPTLSLDIGQVQPEPERVAAAQKALDDASVRLPLQRVGRLQVQTLMRTGKEPKVIDTSTVVVPMADRYHLPIPKPAFFGKVAFSLSLADSGRVLEAGYGKTSGAAAAAGALTALATSETQALNAEAAALKAQSDLVAQQQRLINCRLKPTECK